jgi:hypothetical protein
MHRHHQTPINGIIIIINDTITAIVIEARTSVVTATVAEAVRLQTDATFFQITAPTSVASVHETTRVITVRVATTTIIITNVVAVTIGQHLTNTKTTTTTIINTPLTTIGVITAAAAAVVDTTTTAIRIIAIIIIAKRVGANEEETEVIARNEKTKRVASLWPSKRSQRLPRPLAPRHPPKLENGFSCCCFYLTKKREYEIESGQPVLNIFVDLLFRVRSFY